MPLNLHTLHTSVLALEGTCTNKKVGIGLGLGLGFSLFLEMLHFSIISQERKCMYIQEFA